MPNHNYTVEENMGLVGHIVHKKFNNGKNYRFLGFDQEDFIQVGAIGLAKAIERFDPSLGFQFSTYATHCIVGEIKRELRDNGVIVHFPRNVITAVNKIIVMGKKDDITLNEIMDEFDVNQEYAEMIMTRLHYNTVSGDSPIQNENTDNERITFFDTMEDKSVNVEREASDVVDLEIRLSILNKREREAVELSLTGLTQKEIGVLMEISQVQVSRLVKRAIEKIDQKFNRAIIC